MRYPPSPYLSDKVLELNILGLDLVLRSALYLLSGWGVSGTRICQVRRSCFCVLLLGFTLWGVRRPGRLG